MYKDNAVGNVVAETGRDLVFGTLLRHDWAIFQCRWQARFDAHLNRLQGSRRQPRARSGKVVRRAYSRRALECAYAFSHRALFQRQRCWKRGSGDGQRLSLYDYCTTERSFHVERRGSTLTWTVCTAADSEEQQICTTCLFKSRRALDCEKTTVLCFLPSWNTLVFERGLGEEGRFDVAARGETPKPSCQSHKQQLLWPRSGPSKAAHTRTTRGKAQQVPSKYRKKESN